MFAPVVALAGDGPVCLADVACWEFAVLLILCEGVAGFARLYDSVREGICCDVAEVFGDDG